jgi:uncharacterized protein (TIGR03437 family)
VLHWDRGDTIVPVSAAVPAPPTVTPSITLLTSATNAYLQTVTLSPGEIMSVYGQGFSTATAGLTLGPDGKVATQLAGSSVLVGGTAAPLLYVSPTQVNFVVPYEIAGGTTAAVQVAAPGGSTAPASYPVAAAAPALFTAGSVGGGQAAVLNQDNSVNSATNPAARGSVIQIYATGEGQTSPAGVTGSVTAAPPPTPLLPVSVTIGGVDAPVQFAGSAPGAVAGLLQVNALLPSNVPVSSQAPIVITVGNVASPAGTFIAVQ